MDDWMDVLSCLMRQNIQNKKGIFRLVENNIKIKDSDIKVNYYNIKYIPEDNLVELA